MTPLSKFFADIVYSSYELMEFIRVKCNNLGFDTTSAAVLAIFKHADFADRWDMRGIDDIALGELVRLRDMATK